VEATAKELLIRKGYTALICVHTPLYRNTIRRGFI